MLGLPNQARLLALRSRKHRHKCYVCRAMSPKPLVVVGSINAGEGPWGAHVSSAEDPLALLVEGFWLHW
jgi:hypothetical protein